MSRLFIILLRLLFPRDLVGRSREFMRARLGEMMGWIANPLDVADFEADADHRANLEIEIIAYEYAFNLLVLKRAREMLGLRFLYIPRQPNQQLRKVKSMASLFRRLTQLARNFHNLDKLAAKRAARMKREHDADPLHLNPITPYAVHRAIKSAFEVLPRQRRGRWRAHACARDGGGCASSRGWLNATGPPSRRSTAHCRLPTASIAQRSRTPPRAYHTP